jgi:hypothetical protein
MLESTQELFKKRLSEIKRDKEEEEGCRRN